MLRQVIVPVFDHIGNRKPAAGLEDAKRLAVAAITQAAPPPAAGPNETLGSIFSPRRQGAQVAVADHPKQ